MDVIVSKFTVKTKDPRIQERPPGEKDDFQSKFALPDKEKELELSKLQNEVQDLFKAGQYPRALKSAETLLSETEKHFGKDHPVTASAFNNVGLMQKLLGNFDESRRYYTEALQIYKVTVGTDHASYASILHNLGNLNRNQIHFDDTLKGTDRLTLLETALEQLEQALKIRDAELGPEHPHSVASRSSWGATLAAQILHHYKSTTSSKEQKQYYISLKPQDVTEHGWEAALQHLRSALDTAIQNPRGLSLTPPRRKTKRSKKKQQKEEAALPDIQTLSAASAAQNLAIFLKARATTTDKESTTQEWLEEAHKLYRDILNVRTKLLPTDHPDLYASKHSLAELLDTMGDEEAANAIRQEIVDSYDPEEETGESKEG
jgi:tetratricopeptide (TPR) repeat protein